MTKERPGEIDSRLKQNCLNHLVACLVCVDSHRRITSVTSRGVRFPRHFSEPHGRVFRAGQGAQLVEIANSQKWCIRRELFLRGKTLTSVFLFNDLISSFVLSYWCVFFSFANGRTLISHVSHFQFHTWHETKVGQWVNGLYMMFRLVRFGRFPLEPVGFWTLYWRPLCVLRVSLGRAPWRYTWGGIFGSLWKGGFCLEVRSVNFNLWSRKWWKSFFFKVEGWDEFI